MRFLQGPRSLGVSDESSISQINFAIPSENSLRERMERERSVPREGSWALA